MDATNRVYILLRYTNWYVSDETPLLGFCLANWLIHNYFLSLIDGLPIKINKLVCALISTPSSLFLLNIVEK